MGSVVDGIEFDAPPDVVARALIGATLLVDGVGGRIVEVEAYDQAEAASHAFIGPTARNAHLFGPPGHAYVYRSYGLHWCLNFVCRERGRGAGVLLRAIEPTAGLEAMRARRRLEDERLLCAGPGRLSEALGITLAHGGMSLAKKPFRLRAAEVPSTIVTGPRIGISKAVDLPWRFGLAGSRYWSRPFPRGPRVA